MDTTASNSESNAGLNAQAVKHRGRGRGGGRRGRGRSRNPGQIPVRKRLSRKKGHTVRPLKSDSPSEANAEKKGEENDSFRDKATSSKEWEAQSDNFGTSDECKSPGSNSNIQPSDHTLTVSDGNSNAELDFASEVENISGVCIEESLKTQFAINENTDDTSAAHTNISSLLITSTPKKKLCEEPSMAKLIQMEEVNMETSCIHLLSTDFDNLHQVPKDQHVEPPSDVQQRATQSASTAPVSSERTMKKRRRDRFRHQLFEPIRDVRDSLDFSNTTVNVPFDLLLEAKQKLDFFLFHRWHALLHLNAIHVVLISSQNNVSVQRSVVFYTNGNIELFVHCQPVDIEPFLENATDPVSLKSTSVNEFVQRIVTIVNNVRRMEICSGLDSEDLKAGWGTCPLGEIDKNPYKECRFFETFRSFTCLRLVKRNAWRCSECAKVLAPLRRRAHAAFSQPHPKTANIYLTEEQKLQKLQDQHNKLENARKKISRLQEKMASLIKNEGVTIDVETSNDLTELLSTNKISPAQALFLQQQVKASQKDNSKGMRWHPTMIRLALSLHITSPAAYELLRDTGMVKLPSSRTLFDYAKVKPAQEGIDKVVIESIGKRVDKLKPECKKYLVLMADEMHISQNLVFQKSTGSMIGFTNLDDVDKEVQNLEAYLNDNNDDNREPVIAQKVLVYMVKGVACNIKGVIATYAVANMSVNQMYFWTWAVIGSLERSGVAVIAFVSDGCSVNRAFIKKHKPVTVLENGLIFDTINKAAPDRILYFIADVPHLLKTIRNGLYNSRNKRTKSGRCMTRNGKKITWDFIIKLYESKKSKILRKSFKLNAMHVYPDSYARMKVKYAAQVLSNTVARDLEDQNWADASELILFIEKVNEWFDCLNGAHSFVAKKKKNKNLASYESVDDSRFEVILSFVKYLQEWEKEANAPVMEESMLNLSNVTEDADKSIVEGQLESNEVEDTPASKRTLCRQTVQGIEMTSRAFVAMVKFLLSEGIQFINARVFCQDPLEQHFSKVRAGQGGSTNPNVGQVLNRNRALFTIGEMGMKR